MTESDYLEWVEAGKPDEWEKFQYVIEWWKTDPTLTQRVIVRKIQRIDVFVGFCFGASLVFLISALLIAIII